MTSKYKTEHCKELEVLGCSVLHHHTLPSSLARHSLVGILGNKSLWCVVENSTGSGRRKTQGRVFEPYLFLLGFILT